MRKKNNNYMETNKHATKKTNGSVMRSNRKLKKYGKTNDN